MKNFLSFIFLSALTLCITIQFAQAVQRKGDEDDYKPPVTLPIELQEEIAIEGVKSGPRFYLSGVRVCRAWNKFLTPLAIGPGKAKQLKDSDLVRYQNVHLLIRDELGDYEEYKNSNNTVLRRYEEIKSITNAGLKTLTNLTYLSLKENMQGNWNITDEGIQGLTQLIHLDVREADGLEPGSFYISNEGIKELTNLQTLMLPSTTEGYNGILTGECLKKLIKLIDLDLSFNHEFLRVFT